MWRELQTGCSAMPVSWILLPWTQLNSRSNQLHTWMGSQVGGDDNQDIFGYFPYPIPEYELVAFVSHMGTSTMCGHYVCHILKDGRWIIYNDGKVAVSENPPKSLGYLYLYRRI